MAWPPTAPLKAATIATPSPPSPWSIDPDRTQELPPSGFLTASPPHARTIAPPAPPSPWSIDPDRTQEIVP